MSGLVKRGQVYYYRIRIPRRLIKVFDGRREIWKTLNTQSEQDAHRQCLVLGGKIRQFFDFLEVGMLSETQMRRLACGFVREGLKLSESLRFGKTTDVWDDAWLSLKPENFDQMLQELRADIAACNYNRYFLILDTFLGKTSLEVTKGSEEYNALARHFAIALVQCLEVEQKRRTGDYSNPFDRARYDIVSEVTRPQPQRQEQPAKISPLISELIAAYADEKTTGERWDVKSRQQNLSSLDLMLQIVGDNPVASVTHQQMMAMRDVLRHLPANHSKAKQYRDKSIQAVLRLKNVKPMSVITMNNILTRIASFWHWIELHEYTEKSPARNLLLQTSKRADEERSIYTDSELQLLIDAVSEQSKPTSHPERVWITLIALHSGMRPNEIAQLYLDDVVTENGVLSFRVNDTHPDQKVKNKRARRLVPIHPLLLEFGFERYVKSVSSNRTARLFPKLKHHRDGFHAYFGRWMQDINRDFVTKDKTKAFYSCRHNFVTAMKQAEVDYTVIAEIVGHTVPGETLGRYAKAMKPQVLLDAVKKLHYPVDFTKIRAAAKQTYS